MQPIINYNPDVLTCLANLSNDEVFTPPNVVQQMLDQLPEELWSDKNAKFLDPVSKTGVFLREIGLRLNKGLEKQIPDTQERINHIYKNQLFGIAITELTALLSRRSVYCSKTADSEYSVCTDFDNEQGNIRFNRIEHTWVNERCSYCGASVAEYKRDDELETHAYEFIHTEDPATIFNHMKFDVIIGNPPYQLDTGGSGRQAKPIYQLFIQQAKKLNPRYLTMIVPSRWFAGGMGLNVFRDEMLNDNRISNLTDYVDAKECFPGVDIAGGVCYFLWQNGYSGDCTVVNKFKNAEYNSVRPLNEFNTFVRFAPAVSIVKKIRSKTEPSLTEITSSTRPFGLKTSDRPTKEGDLHMISSKAEGPVSSKRVTAGHKYINHWKVMTSKTSHDHAGQFDNEGMRRVLSRVEVLKPKAVCTESYIVFGPFSNEAEALNCQLYLKTKFARFLVSLLSFSQDITRDRFTHVPLVDMSQPWTDEELYKKYKLTKDEIAFIESLIRPMD